jgi:hypothetical protein
MSNYLSMNGVKKTLELWATNNPSLKHSGFGQPFNVNGEVKLQQRYPQMWTQPVSSTPVLNNTQGIITFNRNLQILFFDTKLADNSNEISVISDMEELAFQFCRWLMNNNDDIDMISSPTITPFTDKFLDDVAGVILDVVVQFNGDSIGCDDPETSFTIPFQNLE